MRSKPYDPLARHQTGGRYDTCCMCDLPWAAVRIDWWTGKAKHYCSLHFKETYMKDRDRREGQGHGNTTT